MCTGRTCPCKYAHTYMCKYTQAWQPIRCISFRPLILSGWRGLVGFRLSSLCPGLADLTTQMIIHRFPNDNVPRIKISRAEGGYFGAFLERPSVLKIIMPLMCSLNITCIYIFMASEGDGQANLGEHKQLFSLTKRVLWLPRSFRVGWVWNPKHLSINFL